MAFDRNAKPVQVIQPNVLDRACLSVGQDDGFADQLGLSLIEFGEDCAGSGFGIRHDMWLVSVAGAVRVAYESVQLVANARPRNVHGTPRRNLPGALI